MEASKIKIKTLCISLATIAFIEVAIKIIVSGSYFNTMVILGTARLLETVLIVLIVLIWGKGMSSIGLAPSTIVRGIKKGLIWSAAFGLVTFFAFIALFLFDINPLRLIHTHLPGKTSEIILFFLIGGIVGPIAEEVFFRGMLYGFFRRWGILMALILTTLIFVLAHPVFLGLPATQVVGGLIFAVAYEVEGSLMVPITIHILGNMAIFTYSLIS
ncbi:MAG: CPBP family intramembrane metalloprotease [Proteobacteria bacterium]|nr:CPBP family intramembrane metalloprotease [Pseudomonadota bacterium]